MENRRVALGKRGKPGDRAGGLPPARRAGDTRSSWAPATMSKAGPQQRDSLAA